MEVQTLVKPTESAEARILSKGKTVLSTPSAPCTLSKWLGGPLSGGHQLRVEDGEIAGSEVAAAHL